MNTSIASRHPKAFFSYTRFDDEHARGKLTAVRTRLEGELRVQLGAPFEIYQDTIDLTWGADWQQRLLSAVDEAVFFIPVITPSYFASSACRTELEAFLRQEQEFLYEQLILPVNWINIDLPKDDLARIIKSRNYVDFRRLRHLPADHPDMDATIETLATQLIQRLNEFNDHQTQIARLGANVISPKQNEDVPRRVTVVGKTESLPKTITPWLVVGGGGLYHPQTTVTTTVWNAKVTIGGAGFGTNANQDFSIYVIATSKSANDAFSNYLTQQATAKKWHGLPLPSGTKILATRTVRRNDQGSTLANLIGTYDEFRAQPLQPTHGTITICGTTHGRLDLIATSQAGHVEWRGTITVDAKTGQATADYQNTANNGRGMLQLQQNTDDIAVTGQGSAPGAKPFYMTWKRR